MAQLPLTFQAFTGPDGQLQLSGLPEDKRLIDALVDAVVKILPYGPAWESQYRALYLLSQPQAPIVSTPAELEAIAVPHYRRMQGIWTGKMVSWQHIELSFDQNNWQPLPPLPDVQEASERLARHPAFEWGGEVLGTFSAEHWQAGRIDLEPEPPENILELLEEVAAIWHGLTEEAWLNVHRQWAEDEQASAPQAKRSTFEVRELPALLPPFAFWYGGLVFQMLTGSEYTLDGEEWLPYASAQVGQAEDDDDMTDPFAMFSDLLNLNTLEVYLSSDGQIKWPKHSPTPELAEQVQALLLAQTGAGTPEWAAHTRALLQEEPEEDVAQASQAVAPFEVPAALRLTLLPDLLEVPELASGAIARAGVLSAEAFAEAESLPLAQAESLAEQTGQKAEAETKALPDTLPISSHPDQPK